MICCNVSSESIIKMGWGYLIFFFFFLPNFSPLHNQNTVYLLNFTLMFDRYHCSSAAVIPVKYECNLNGYNKYSIKARVSSLQRSYPTHLQSPPLPGHENRCTDKVNTDQNWFSAPTWRLYDDIFTVYYTCVTSNQLYGIISEKKNK